MLKKLLACVLSSCLLSGIALLPSVSASEKQVLFEDNFNEKKYTNDRQINSKIIRDETTKGIGGRLPDDMSLMIDSRGITQGSTIQEYNNHIRYDYSPSSDAGVAITAFPLVIEISVYLNDLLASKQFEFTPMLSDGATNQAKTLAEINGSEIKARVGEAGSDALVKVGTAKAGNWYHFAFVIKDKDGLFDMYINHNKVEQGERPFDCVFKSEAQMTGYIRTKFNTSVPATEGQIIDTMTAFDDVKIYAGVQPDFIDKPVGITSNDDTILTVDQAMTTISFNAVSNTTASAFKEKVNIKDNRGTIALFHANGEPLTDNENIADDQILRLTYPSDNGYIIINYDITDSRLQKFFKDDFNTSSSAGIIGRTNIFVGCSDDTKAIVGRSLDDRSMVISMDNYIYGTGHSGTGTDAGIKYELNQDVTKFPIVLETSIYIDDFAVQRSFEFWYKDSDGNKGSDILRIREGALKAKTTASSDGDSAFTEIAQLEEKNWYHVTVVIAQNRTFEVFLNHKKIDTSSITPVLKDGGDITQIHVYKLYQNTPDVNNGDVLNAYTAYDDINVYAGIRPPFEGTAVDVAIDDGATGVTLDKEGKTITFDNEETVSSLIAKFAPKNSMSELSIVSALGRNFTPLHASTKVPSKGAYLRHTYDSGEHGIIIVNYALEGPVEELEFTFDKDVDTATAKLTIDTRTDDTIAGKLMIVAYGTDGEVIDVKFCAKDVSSSTGTSSFTTEAVSIVGATKLGAFFWGTDLDKIMPIAYALELIGD